MCIGDESDYRKIGEKEMEEFIKTKLGDSEISEALRKIKKS